MKIFLYFNDWKFRSHTVKHMTNPYTYKNWKSLLSKLPPWEQIESMVEQLKNLGCLYLLGDMDDPLCNQGWQKCSNYQICSAVVGTLEDQYLKCIERVINEGIFKPRFSCYEDRTGSEYLVIVHDLKFEARALYHHRKKTYNLLTCFGISLDDLSLGEFIDRLRRRINGTSEYVIWCVEDTWYLDGKNRPSGKGRYKTGERVLGGRSRPDEGGPKGKTRYVKGKRGGWKKELE